MAAVAFVVDLRPVHPPRVPVVTRLPPQGGRPGHSFPETRLRFASVAAFAVGAAFGRRRVRPRRRTAAASSGGGALAPLSLVQLGRSAFDKALHVNLDPNFYGSFAEIGAGQEVSRTFLTAGAASGTVARAISAYDMEMSDALYGHATRYVSSDRLQTMLAEEYGRLEETLRKARGPEVRFFAFASTLAARAFNKADSECQGWVGLTYQAAPGAERSTVTMHVRMGDATAEQQGEAIGVLGTNLVYLCHSLRDPYQITSFLLDGVEEGRLEIDMLSFEGPGFPEGTVKAELLAMRMVQFRLASCVLLEPSDAPTSESGYVQVAPNDALHRKPIVVQRSRFRPLTRMHKEVTEAAARKFVAEAGPDASPPEQMLNVQIDELTLKPELVASKARLERLAALKKAADDEGRLSVEGFAAITGGKLADNKKFYSSLGARDDSSRSVSIERMASLDETTPVAREFLVRFAMLGALKLPILVSRIRQTHELAEYLSRYTKERIAIAVGGGAYSYSGDRALFSEQSHASFRGGLLEAIGRLFAGNVQIYEYPNISAQGVVSPPVPPDGALALLHEYLSELGLISPIASEHLSPVARNAATNSDFRQGCAEVLELLRSKSDAWERHVPPEVAEIIKTRRWFEQFSSGQDVAAAARQTQASGFFPAEQARSHES